jgi:hypothetical protein
LKYIQDEKHPWTVCLLDHPGLVPLPITTCPEERNQPGSPCDADGRTLVETGSGTVNNNQQESDGKLMVCVEGSSGSLLQNLLDDQAKSFGRKQKFEEQQQAKEDNENKKKCTYSSKLYDERTASNQQLLVS